LYRDLERNLIIKANQIVSILNAYAKVSQLENDPLYLMQQFISERRINPTNRKIIDELWQTDMKSLGMTNDYYRIINANKQIILRSTNYTESIGVVFDASLVADMSHVRYADITFNGTPYHIVHYPVSFMNKFPLVLQLATPIDALVKILQQLIFAMLLGICAILVLTSFLGSVLTSRILKPVTSIIKTAESISHHDFSKRIEVREFDHEMQALIDAFNTMLDRLEKSFLHISEFSSHVAHELKTPLTIIRGELELAIGDGEHDTESTRVMHTTLEEIDHLIKIVKDLLLLARLDYRPDVFQFSPTNLVPFMQDVYEHGKMLASEKDITIGFHAVHPELLIYADIVHLRRLFFNVLHNAIKYTPPKGSITITIESVHKNASVAIQDTGCGIATENIEKIFDKFFRLKNEELSSDYGAGLGLSIARSIAKAHQGEIAVQSRIGEGTTFTVFLPLISA
jgi:signal transduction histidine kinase